MEYSLLACINPIWMWMCQNFLWILRGVTPVWNFGEALPNWQAERSAVTHKAWPPPEADRGACSSQLWTGLNCKKNSLKHTHKFVLWLQAWRTTQNYLTARWGPGLCIVCILAICEWSLTHLCGVCVYEMLPFGTRCWQKGKQWTEASLLVALVLTMCDYVQVANLLNRPKYI